MQKQIQKKLQVFVSSTYVDLIEERQKAVEAILNAGHIPAGMELFKAGKSQMETIKKWINESDVYCLILGGRYGSIEKESGFSYTQLEYEYALLQGKPVFAIVLSDSMIYQKAANDPKGNYIEEGENQFKYQQFKNQVGERIYKVVSNIEEIANCVSLQLYDILIEQSAELTGWVRGTQDVVKAIKEVDSDFHESKKGNVNQEETNPEEKIKIRIPEKIADTEHREERLKKDELKKLEEIDERISRFPQDPQLYVERAELLVSMDNGYLQKAVVDYLYAIFLDPEYSEAYYDMIQRLTKGKDYVRALRYAEEVCRIFPNDGNSYGCRAYVKCAKRLYSDSIDDCNKAIELLANRWFYNTRGRCYLGMDRLNEALEDFVTSHRLDNDYVHAVKNVKFVVGKIGILNIIDTATDLKKAGNFQKSKLYLEGAMLAEPDNEKVLQEFGGWYYDRGRFFEALEYWEKALEIKKSCRNYQLCAVAYQCLGEYANAIEDYRLALQYPDGNHKEINEQLQILTRRESKILELKSTET